MFERRDLLKLAGTAALSALATPAFAQDDAKPEGKAAPAPVPFNPSSVVDLARDLSAKTFVAPQNDLPAAFANLSPDAFAAIKAKPEALVWADGSSPFVIEPLHRGFVYSAPLQIYVVEDGAARRLAYDPAKFSYGAANLPTPPASLDFSGFRVLQRDDKGILRELAVFQGANIFKALAPGQNLGVSARGLAIRTGDPRGEEFPIFRAMWIEKSSFAVNALTIHALLDSDSLSGAYRFTIHPGEATIIDVECALFPRVNIDMFGLAAMSATTLFNPLDRRGDDDLREAAAEISGLQMLTGGNEWLWRPVANRTNLQISEFVDQNPKGFGFLQRQRAFDDFYDLAQFWEKRPSLWIEPIGDWGAGSVELVEIPSDNETAQNMIAFWRSKTPLIKGQQADFAFRQFWCWTPPAAPPVARAFGSRGGRGPGQRQRRFFVEFRGDALGDAARLDPAVVNLSAFPGKTSAIKLVKAPDAKTVYVQFDLDPGSEPASEIRLTLDVQGAPLTETWLYRWTQ